MLDAGANLPFMIGRQLGHYRVESKLGQGGMGVVYRAIDTHLDRHVAIKVLAAEAVLNPERKRRFVQEAKAASALNHPNILHIYDIDTVDGVDFIAMEYVPGKDLAQLIARGRLSLGEALKYAVQVAEALGRAHAAGIIHRDLKPANIMVNEQGLVKVLDFGLAKLAEPIETDEHAPTQTLKLDEGPRTEEGAILGTAAYMSPEQVEGKKLDTRSDIFSFGSVLYEILSGRRAFQGETRISTLSQVVHRDPRPLTESGAQIPNELERVVLRCLRKDPDRRFQHVADVRIALLELKEESDSGRLSAEHPGRAQPARRWMSIGAVAAVALVLAAGAALTWWLAWPRHRAQNPVLTRVTSDSGLTFEPALSPDGKLVAYASDRSSDGNLDIWAQQIGGGQPIRLTTNLADDRQPAFSPDGTKIVFRSRRDGGGLYVVPTLGGEARLLAKRGAGARFSPDGNWVAFVVASSGSAAVSRSKLYVSPSGGGEPRALQTDFTADFPVWSPDGKRILFAGAPQVNERATRNFDWWITPLEGGAAAPTGASAAFRRGKLAAYSAGDWVGDRVVFNADSGNSTNLWQIALSKDGRATGLPERLTFGAAHESRPSATADGTRLAFASVIDSSNIWSLPLDANQGKVTGQLEHVTEGVAEDLCPSASADGQRIAFISYRSGQRDIWIKDSRTSKEAPLTADSAAEYYPTLTPDGSKVAYRVDQNNKQAIYVLPSGGGVPEKMCGDCGRPWGWSSHGELLLYSASLAGDRLAIGLLRTGANEKKLVLEHPERSLDHASFSPDDRWICFLMRGGSTGPQIFIAPFREGMNSPPDQWTAVTKIDFVAATPRWSPDGNLLYFLSKQDEFNCLWAQRLERRTKRPVGGPFPVHHFHQARLSPENVHVREFEISITRSKVILPLGGMTGNIWIADMAQK